MGADLSRVRFDPRRDHSGVLMQQGRLLLDADWNELVAVVDRRMRAAAADLGSEGPTPGIAGVAVVPRTTPDAFLITLAGGGLSIGRGRMYVDGLLVHNHGTGPVAFDPLLDEVSGTADTPYAAQPYWPTPDPLPTTGTHLVYLDVWTREVTPLEDPDLVEIAVGVDTTARSQTVWQVRVHAPDTAGIVCSTPDADITGWPAAIAPSAGQLTTDTIPVLDTDDPCALPPTGGYRGLENQTYRVEIHDAGAPGTATFKWSRDNGSVASAVTEVVSSTSIRPASLGKDGVLRFDTGDWVEITDDVREFDQRAGVIRRVDVHDEDGTMTFAPALPADLVMTTAQAAARHLRVRRWDQHGQQVSATGTALEDLDAAGSSGVVTVPASGVAVVLESGLTAQLTAAGGGGFHVGDHWIFAARTADTSVEKLVAAPPLAIHHHYARLGVVTFPDAVTDCRTPWPSGCTCDGDGCSDCSACVTPESHASGSLTIQMAVDSVVQTGGTVCLAAGTYQLPQSGVVIADAASVTVRGQGSRTLLLARGPGITVQTSQDIRLHDFAVIGSVADLVTVQSTGAFTAERLDLLVLGEAAVAGFAMTGVMLVTTLRDNVVFAATALRGGGAETPLVTAELDVGSNVLIGRDVGVDFDGPVAHLLRNAIHDNTIAGGATAGLRALGLVAPAADLTVRGNHVAVEGAGLEVGAGGYAVIGNEVFGAADTSTDGIGVTGGGLHTPAGSTRITGNSVRGFAGVGIVVSVPVRDLTVTGNEVIETGDGIVMNRKSGAETAVVSGNLVRDIGARERDSSGASGIVVVGAERTLVESNTVRGVGTDRSTSDGAVGIGLLGCGETRVAGNAVDRIGAAEGSGRTIGIALAGALGRSEVHGNLSRRDDGDDLDATPPTDWIGLLVGLPALGGDQVTHPTIAGYQPVAVGDDVTYLVGNGHLIATGGRVASVIVSDNSVTGGGESPAMQIGVRGDVVLATNQARQRLESAAPCVQLLADSASVSANRARGGRPSMDLRVDPKRIAVLGNITSSGIEVSGGGLGVPWAPLNPDGVV